MKKFLGYGFQLPNETLEAAVKVYDNDFHKTKKMAIESFKDMQESDVFKKTPFKKVKFFKATLVIE